MPRLPYRLTILLLLLLPWLKAVSAATDDAELFRGVERHDLAVIETALKNGASLTATNSRGWSPLIEAVNHDDLAAIRLLIEHGADVNGRSAASQGSYVIHFAAAKANLKVLELLAVKGARLDQLTLKGGSPLAVAISRGGAKSVECLLKLGADPNAPCFRGESGEWITPLGHAAVRLDTNVAGLLLKYGAELERPSSSGNTPLMLAAHGEARGPMVRWLLAQGANPKAHSPRGYTALIFAAYHGDAETVEALLAAGADPKARAADPEEEGIVSRTVFTPASVALDSG